MCPSQNFESCSGLGGIPGPPCPGTESLLFSAVSSLGLSCPLWSVFLANAKWLQRVRLPTPLVNLAPAGPLEMLLPRCFSTSRAINSKAPSCGDKVYFSFPLPPALCPFLSPVLASGSQLPPSPPLRFHNLQRLFPGDNGPGQTEGSFVVLQSCGLFLALRLLFAHLSFQLCDKADKKRGKGRIFGRKGNLLGGCWL